MGHSSKEFYDSMSRDDCQGMDFHDWLAVVAGPTLPKGNDMNINNAFPSDYLKCADLQGRTLRATIANVRMVEIGKDTKPALYFHGKQKGLILNKTKSMTLADAWGPETDNWINRDVSLRPTRVPFEGKMTDSIALEPVMEAVHGEAPQSVVQQSPQPPQAPPQEWRQNAPPATHGADFIDDQDVPF